MREILKITSNGQWSLEKNWKNSDIKAVEQWADSGIRDHLKKLPAATGKLRHNMLTQLHTESESRTNPISKEKEYKAYRTADVGDNSHKNQLTSWTTWPHFAHYWAGLTPNDKKIMHAWIPEKYIHSYLPYVQQKYKHEHNEGEMLVHPHNAAIDKIVTGKALDKELKEQKITKIKQPTHFNIGNNKTVNQRESQAMHGQPHPFNEGEIWQHHPHDAGWVNAPGYKSAFEGNNYVMRKGDKIVWQRKMI